METNNLLKLGKNFGKFILLIAIFSQCSRHIKIYSNSLKDENSILSEDYLYDNSQEYILGIGDELEIKISRFLRSLHHN